ncbi:hypothetical protein [Shewanella japonica]|uniref:Response receiver domain-containing protein n=1 Tax=Shewanella japonica TaxID=93973 RepID=A0ABN4Y9K6_9GAMM|nr:hypothetical protein [Shewanella japonica]ARD20698.1 hypothetical protein SJ2017_0352 [Shewanella japonica]
MPHKSRVLIVDDKREDGEAIVRRLWELQIPCFFLKYSEENLFGLDSQKAYTGIRAIFQDIALITTSMPDNKDYAAAQLSIDTLLDNENGPWLLIAWSTWAEDPEKGTQYAEELFRYLKERLPEGKKPYDFVVLDKTPFCANGPHSELKTEDNLTSLDKGDLLNKINEQLSTHSNLALLNQWEQHIHQAASKTVHDLWNAVENDETGEKNQQLGGILLALAKAEGGTVVEHTDVAGPLYQLLSKLLFDQASQLVPSKMAIENPIGQNPPKERLNGMLHWDNVCSPKAPGGVFKWPANGSVDLGVLAIAEDNTKEFIKDAFVKDDINKQKGFEGARDILDNVELVLMDITPSCDHAQKKAFWRRYLVGIRVVEEHQTHFYAKQKLPTDNLKDTPVFEVDGKKFRFIFNSKLVVSLVEKNEYYSSRGEGVQGEISYTPDSDKLIPIGRIRDELLKDIQAWYGRMATRPGIVSF